MYVYTRRQVYTIHPVAAVNILYGECIIETTYVILLGTRVHPAALLCVCTYIP